MWCAAASSLASTYVYMHLLTFLMAWLATFEVL